MINCILLDSNPIINGSDNAVNKTVTNATTGTASVAGVPAAKSVDMFSTITVYALMFVAAYWFFIRPHKKRQEKLFDFQSKLQPGDEVITSAGLHGKIIEVHDKTFLIEFGVNKGVRIPVDRNQVIANDNSEETEE